MRCRPATCPTSPMRNARCWSAGIGVPSAARPRCRSRPVAKQGACGSQVGSRVSLAPVALPCDFSGARGGFPNSILRPRLQPVTWRARHRRCDGLLPRPWMQHRFHSEALLRELPTRSTALRRQKVRRSFTSVLQTHNPRQSSAPGPTPRHVRIRARHLRPALTSSSRPARPASRPAPTPVFHVRRRATEGPGAASTEGRAAWPHAQRFRSPPSRLRLPPPSRAAWRTLPKLPPAWASPAVWDVPKGVGRPAWTGRRPPRCWTSRR